MTNKKYSKIFKEISQMLEIKGENRFKVIAYENAARKIKIMADDLEDVYKGGGIKELVKLDGIGEGIAEKIEELIKTGKCKYHQELQKDIPKGEIDLLKVPGIGPSTAKKLYKKLEVKSISELRRKAKAGEIRNMEGFGKTTEKNILRSIASLRKHSKEGKRLILDYAEYFASEIVAFLEECPAVKKCEVVGSLRRWRETIGDIDIAAASGRPDEVIEYFRSFPRAKKVLLAGSKKISIEHKEGIRIDVHVLEPKRYGSLLHHLTGSKDHNVALRTWAEKRKLKISEYGIKDLKKKKEHLFATEKEFFKFLGMQYIYPELRENRGEIEAALENKLPRLVKLADIKGALHVHTDESDGQNTMEEMAAEALKRGYKYIGISDHSVGLGVAQGLDKRRLEKQLKKIARLNKKYKGKIHILSGAEVNIKADGELDLPESILKKLDIVVASVHSSFLQSEEKMTERVLKAIDNPYVKIIGHPSGRIIGRRDEIDMDWPRIFKAAKENGVALEVNCFPNRLDLRDVYIREALKNGCKLAIDTDAHSISHFDFIKYGIHTARRGWAQKKDIINTMEWKDLKKWLKK